MSAEIDLGNGYIGHLIAASDARPHPSGYLGITIRHPTPDGGQCGYIATWDGARGPDHTWTLVSLDPLHIEPSLLCHTCGGHGFVRNGRWEPA